MLKVYEWLVYNFMRPHKKFQHFIKWFDICFIRTTTNINKKRKERLNRGKRKNLPLAWGEAHLSSRPSPPGLPCLLLQAGAQLRGDHAVAADEPPGHLLLSLAFSSRLEASHRRADPFPPPPRTLSSSPSPFSSKSESSPERTAVETRGHLPPDRKSVV